MLAFGFLMNLLHGAVAAYYLTHLSAAVPQHRRGTVFGLAYAAGSIGTWIISAPAQGRFLAEPGIFAAYAAMALGAVALDGACAGDANGGVEPAEPLGFNRAAVPLAAVVVVLLSLVKGLGFYFPSADAQGTVSAEAMRAFYAVGLIAAGLVNDISRKWGAICCLCSLAFPFISFAMRGEPETNAALWVTGYIFFGFFSVYRAVLFADIAKKRRSFLPLACLGLLFGRVGDAAGAAVGIVMHNHLPVLIWVATALFIITVLLFLFFFDKVYSVVLPPDESAAVRMHGFEEAYGLSARESDVFALILNGRSNSEIAADLYVSENTVKFHVKNVLRKTGCANRTQLIAAYRATAHRR